MESGGEYRFTFLHGETYSVFEDAHKCKVYAFVSLSLVYVFVTAKAFTSQSSDYEVMLGAWSLSSLFLFRINVPRAECVLEKMHETILIGREEEGKFNNTLKQAGERGKRGNDESSIGPS